jgi:branched-chain amino acid transport system permease protein
MQHLVQYGIEGLGFGGIYALAALGLVLIFKTSGVVNFAFGAMATVVTLVLWTVAIQVGLPVVIAWLVALLFALLLGAFSDVALLRRIEGAPILIQIVLTLGLLLLIEGLAGVVWGYSPKAVPPVLSGSSVGVGPFLIKRNDLFILALTLAIGAIMYVIFERTRLGLAMRAVAADREVASMMGIRTNRIVTTAWAVGVLISGVAAILVAPTISLSPTMMDDIAVFAFAAAILGGFGSLAGAIVGGLAIGVLSNLIAAYISTNLQLTLVFVLIIGLLYVRPQGLFGVAASARQ